MANFHKNIDALNRAKSAASDSLLERLAIHELTILNRLVASYRGGVLTTEAMWGGIAAIAELRSIATEATHDLLRGAEAATDLARTQ